MTQVLRDEYESGEREQQDRYQARHIKNNVDKARKNHQVAGQKWPFELLQNAHDPGPREGLSRVDVTFSWICTDQRAELSFKHNGAAFLPQDLAALLSGGSNKDYNSEKTTGRYGTGFLITHVLSASTEVGGLSKTKEGMERFTVTLNRSGDEKSILKNIKDCKADLDKATRVDNVSDLPSAEFKYLVDNSSSMEQGLTSLREALPYLFATCPALGSVNLHVDGVDDAWSPSEERETSSGAFLIRERRLHRTNNCGDITEYEVLSISSHASTPSIIVVAELMNDKWRVCMPTETLPHLFRRFPILYSLDLPINFVIDGLFNVGEDRQYVYFESENDEAYVHAALCLIPTVMGILTEKNWEGSHFLSAVAKPSLSPFIPEDRLMWWQTELGHVARGLSEMPLVQTERGLGQALNSEGWSADFVSPIFSASLPRVVNYERLWGLIASTDHFIPPILEISRDWTGIAEGWQQLGVNVQLVTLEELANEVRKAESGAKIESIDQLRVLTDRREWVSRFLDLIGETLTDLEAFDLSIAEGLLPNQLGKMKSPRELSRDGGIPENLKDIANSIGADVRSTLVDTELVAVARQIGLAHTEIALEKLVPRLLTEDEVVDRCLKRLEEKLVNGKRMRDDENTLLGGSVRLLDHIWNDKSDSAESKAKRCPLVASDKTILRHTESQPIMPPVKRWPEKAQPFYAAYPEQRVLDAIYAGDSAEGIPDVVDALTSWGIVYRDILTQSNATLDTDRLRALTNNSSNVDGMTASVEKFSQIALLARELIPRSGSNLVAARALLGLTLCYVAPRDSQWRQFQSVEAKNGNVKVSVSVREALWVADLQSRAWVPAKGDEGKTISVVASPSNLETLLDPSWLDGNNDAIELMSNCFGFDALKLRLLVAANNETERQKIRDDLANLIEAAGSDLEILKDLKTAIEARKKQKSDIGRWRKLGLGVQSAVQESLEARNLKVTVIDIGGDFEVVIQEGRLIDEATLALLEIRDFIVEVKATTHGEPRMTPAQAVNAAENVERYVLCVVDLRNVADVDLDKDWTASQVEPLMRLMPDIGNYVRLPTDLITQARSCDVKVRNDSLLRYGVPANVWESGIGLDEWLTNITTILTEN